MRLFQQDIARIQNPIDDVFNVSTTGLLQVADPVALSVVPDADVNPSVETNPPAEDNEAVPVPTGLGHEYLRNHIPARIVANARINPIARATGSQAREQHLHNQNLLWCTKGRHWRHINIFGDLQTCQGCRQTA
jgi:hypothetical protein